MSKSQFSINQRFEFLSDLTSMVVNDTTPSLILVGTGGIGKSHCVIESIKENDLSENDYIIIKGYSTARALYNTLYDNNGKLIVFDDCDSVLDDKVAVNILKSALDSYDIRTVSWNTKMNKSDVYPQSFDFNGRVIFISNKDKDKIDGAILSRSLTVDLSMTPDEKIERMTYILADILPEYGIKEKRDALNFLEHNKNIKNLNMRTLIMVTKIRTSYTSTWKNLATYMIST